MSLVRFLLKTAATVAVVLFSLTCAQARTHVNVNLNFGDVGYFGVIPPMSGYTPRVWNTNPVVAVGAAIAGVAAIYLNVPNAHRKDWKRYCGQYNACDKPVHFVQGNWYRQVYAPQYRKNHGMNTSQQKPRQQSQSSERRNPPKQNPQRGGRDRGPNDMPRRH